jgi:hypothetical protein
VIALGGNDLLRRGEPATAANQLRAARNAAALLGPVSRTARLVITHGNGPQVGLLALKEDAYNDGAPYPLDVLDAESGGQIGYVVELELDNAIDHQDTVAVITRVLVDAEAPAFGDPTKFIGPIYDEQNAHVLAAERGWVVKPDGDYWRRVVASPDPKQIIQPGAIRRLVNGGFLVVCVGGGGVPVIGVDGGHAGVEAVIDKGSRLRAAGDRAAGRRARARDRRRRRLHRLGYARSACGRPGHARVVARAGVPGRLDGAEGRGRLPLRRDDRPARRDRAARGDLAADCRDGGHAGRRAVAGRRVPRLSGISQA